MGATALLLAYIALLLLAGFAFAAPLLVLSVCRFMGSHRLVRDGIVGILLSATIWLVFTHLLHVELP